MGDENQGSWLHLQRGAAPLLLCLPHTGTEIPARVARTQLSPWLATKDTDWWIERLYAFAADLGATLIRTGVSRSVIDANRDPSGVSLYPGQATTELCPTTTFDGEPLYASGSAPGPEEIAARRREYFEPYHRAVADELLRLRSAHRAVVLYDCHSIRSQIPRLFPGTLPHFNIGTNSGASCAGALLRSIESICDATPYTRVTDGRFRGGYTTRHYGAPQDGVHAVQMELACRGYLREPAGEVDAGSWPCPYDAAYAAPLRAVLARVLQACLAFAGEPG
ncbi:MAG TPA: N-formylglutamate deformylase [Steroidobacteraceae bacterium]|jgi:N-formylglutamate deformylase|nr:N-formylglutamate deformylase [Steroidobacteraceae bacterium]